MTKTTEKQTSNSIATEIPRLGEVKSILEFEEGISTLQKNIRGSFFMFVESGCISTNIEFTVL